MKAQTKVLPEILTFSEAKYYIFSSVFVALAVFVPWLTHQFHIAGPKFVPMHFFVLIAGFLFGWRAGMMTGVISPMLSYGITHMPPIAILPETMLELAAYGFAVGVLREKNFNILTALLSAMILGRLARFFFVLAFGLQTDPLKYFQASLPGIILQIILIPLIIYFLQRFLFKKSEARI